MAIYIVVNDEYEMLERKDRERPPTQDIVNKYAAQGKRIIPLVDLPDPVYDPETEILTGFPPKEEYVVEATRVTRIKGVRDLTQEELDRNEFNSTVQNVRQTLKERSDELDLHDDPDGADLTAAQRLNRLESYVADNMRYQRRILKELYGGEV